jgi:hypothetical protein
MKASTQHVDALEEELGDIYESTLPQKNHQVIEAARKKKS